MCRLDLVPSQVGNDLGTDGSDAHASEECKCERAVHQHLLPLCLRGIGGIEMDRLYIHSEQRHPDVVDICDRPSRTVLEYVANFEVLVVKAGCLAIVLRAELPVRR